MRGLILTDHANHSNENSLYDLASEMTIRPEINELYVASRYNGYNTQFFSSHEGSFLEALLVDDTFSFQKNNHPLEFNLSRVDVRSFDFIWLRLPPPLSFDFLSFINKEFPELLIINDPMGIYETGSKSFLKNFESCCPLMKNCSSVEDIKEFMKAHNDVVLKPNRDYGGKGILRIKDRIVHIGDQRLPFKIWEEKNQESQIDHVAVKFLNRVTEGDKRIIVIDGHIMGASLRKPSVGSWICNVAMGGSSNATEVTQQEIDMVKQINPILANKGIVMYGIDTLTGDDGHRVLSEVNTTSIGGLPQIAAMDNKPLVKNGINYLVNYITRKIHK